MSLEIDERSLLDDTETPVDPLDDESQLERTHNDRNFAAVRGPSNIDSNIVAIFVVAFDTRSGNILEWSLPAEFEYGDIEFKAMASGLHTIFSDFNYFKIGQLFGLSCYQRLQLEGEEAERERGARMKSVGVLAMCYSGLHDHMEFLQQAVERLNKTPGNYGALEEYYQSHMVSVPVSEEPAISLRNVVLPRLTITHSAGSFAQVWHFFGENIFVLWKAALLRQRILFVSPPPTGVTCYRVYCACLMASHSVGVVAERDVNPLFYINLADIQQLEKESSYVACTTEKIFAMKTHLYDIYVDNQNITVLGQIRNGIHCTGKDCLRYQEVENQLNDHALSVSEEGILSKDKMLIENFQRMNNKILSKLADVSRSDCHDLSKVDINELGLDPINDHAFLQQLIDLYSFDVNLEPIGLTACCPLFC
ncbi:DENN domain-containing protein 11-like [Corticium candelabrum]|uniref:DENN domain-containing protein 11-like n=1 Tax=Corticium candelabrum TaxID=121492 RepID=UPI002E2628CA|nr:DENN domain-containing protein 11-like [Corticium candelabrum]